MSEMGLDTIVAGLYAAVSGQEDWDVQWSRLVAHLGARSSIAWIQGADGAVDPLTFPILEPAAAQRYFQYYHLKDPYNATVPPGAQLMLRGEQVIRHAAYLECEFYRDFVCTLPQRPIYFMGGCTPIGGGQVIRIGFQREHGLADFDAGDVARLAPVMPHLRSMMSVRASLRLLAERSDRAHAVLDELADAIFCVDRDGGVLFRNRAAIALSDAGGAVGRDGGGRPVLAGPVLRPLLPSIRAVAAGGAGQTILLHDDAGKPAMVTVTRLGSLPEGATRPLPGRQGLSVLVRFRGVPPRASLARSLRDLFGLTQAEAGVAIRLADGEDIAEIAAERSVSVHTVRSQLRTILVKSEARSLRDLVRIIGRL